MIRMLRRLLQRVVHTTTRAPQIPARSGAARRSHDRRLAVIVARKWREARREAERQLNRDEFFQFEINKAKAAALAEVLKAWREEEAAGRVNEAITNKGSQDGR